MFRNVVIKEYWKSINFCQRYRPNIGSTCLCNSTTIMSENIFSIPPNN